MAIWTLELMRQEVRSISGRPSESQMTTAQIDRHINEYYTLVMPVDLELEEIQDFWTKDTAAGVDTVALAQLGTTIRKTQTGGNDRVLKMVASKTTDANGEVTCAEPVLQRELYSVSGSGSQTNYEDTLITNGYLGRNFYGPYALTITKAGYAEYVEEKFLDLAVEKYPLGPETVEVNLMSVDSIWDDTFIEGTLTPRQTMRLCLSALAGKSDGIGSDTVHTRDIADSKDRITASVDTFGNRIGIVVDAS